MTTTVNITDDTKIIIDEIKKQLSKKLGRNVSLNEVIYSLGVRYGTFLIKNKID